jgi:hypothetical protein
MSDRTPDQVLSEIRTARSILEKGSDKLYDAELAAERAEDAAQLALDRALLTAEGSIPEKQAHARVASAELRDLAFIARAELNRVKAKIRALESSMMSLQSELKWMKDEGA